MNIKKYFAPDMRRAINLVRSEHGPDAVILSSESVEGGIEIIAAVDYDQSLMSRMLGGRDTISRASVEQPVPAEADLAEPPLAEPIAPVAAASADEPTASEAMTTRSGAAELADLDTTRELKAIQKDLYALKGLMRERFAWSDLRAMTPERSWLMRRAEAFGLTAEIADQLVAAVQHPDEEARAWREIVFALARRLTVMRDDPLEQGGIFALVGPSGAGKTTTIAKLAARHCMRFGRESLALITTDNFRVGAHRQLDAFGAILGVPVRTAGSPEKLARLLDELSGRRLVLIDTAGVAPKDNEITASLSDLDVDATIARFIVLAANMQASVMQEAVSAFGGRQIAGAVLTKLDETNALGAAISVLVKSRLPAVWLSDGQRVPEDLKLARVAHLLKRATVLPETVEESTVPAFVAEAHAAGKGSEAHAPH